MFVFQHCRDTYLEIRLFLVTSLLLLEEAVSEILSSERRSGWPGDIAGN